tara:strand:- start:81 stop:692 length:612 start_codon:yes stop_codon:yes gene_type:complete
MQTLAIVGMGMQAIGTIRAGQAQAANYKAQAQQTLIQARSDVIRSRKEELAHKNKGVEILKSVARNLATINARGAAGALDPFSGSTGNLMTVNLKEGYLDYGFELDNAALAQQNQNIIQGSAEYQARIYRQAASEAKTQAYISAITNLAMGGSSMGKLSTPGAPPTASTAPMYTSGGSYGMNVRGSFGAMPPSYYGSIAGRMI